MNSLLGSKQANKEALPKLPMHFEIGYRSSLEYDANLSREEAENRALTKRLHAASDTGQNNQ